MEKVQVLNVPGQGTGFHSLGKGIRHQSGQPQLFFAPGRDAQSTMYLETFQTNFWNF
jgi:hypothetical protein